MTPEQFDMFGRTTEQTRIAKLEKALMVVAANSTDMTARMWASSALMQNTRLPTRNWSNEDIDELVELMHAAHPFRDEELTDATPAWRTRLRAVVFTILAKSATIRGWGEALPIDQAPRDGTPILGLNENGAMCLVCFWKEEIADILSPDPTFDLLWRPITDDNTVRVYRCTHFWNVPELPVVGRLPEKD